MSAFAAVDLGASSGRVVVGEVVGRADGEVVGRADGASVRLTEVHRFPNTPVQVGPTLHWDVLALYRGMLDGLREATRRFGRLSGVGIDSWAVDHGLLDADGALLGNPVHYRDPRTDGVPEQVFATVPADELYRRTGLQVQPFNTVFQLVAAQGSAQLAAARRLLLVPDLLAFWLTGAEGAELTNASTTGLLDVTTRRWAVDLAERLGVDPGLLPQLREPGTVVGHVRQTVLTEIGHVTELPVLAVGSHDTASAVVGVPGEGAFAYVSCGTWSLVGVELDAPVLTEAGRAANITNELGVDGTVRYLRNVMGLWLLQESVRTWAEAGRDLDLAHLLREAAALPALRTVVDVDDPVFRPPGDLPARLADAARATDQPVPTTPAEVTRCVVDSLALAHRAAVRQVTELSGRPVSVVHVVGGGARNALLCRLTAEATGLQVLAGPVEATALGNVLVQARAAGALSGDLAALRAVGRRSVDVRRYEPDGPGAVGPDAWDEAAARLG